MYTSTLLLSPRCPVLLPQVFFLLTDVLFRKSYCFRDVRQLCTVSAPDDEPFRRIAADNTHGIQPFSLSLPVRTTCYCLPSWHGQRSTGLGIMDVGGIFSRGQQW